MICNAPLTPLAQFPNRVCAQFCSFSQVRELFSIAADDVTSPFLRGFVWPHILKNFSLECFWEKPISEYCFMFTYLVIYCCPWWDLASPFCVELEVQLEPLHLRCCYSSFQRNLQRKVIIITRWKYPFSVAGPRMWNSLPNSTRSSSSVTMFKRSLKTFFFNQ